MISLHTLTNNVPRKKTKCLGRGPGCKKGKTCGRGHKGSGSRSGYKRRWGQEGGGIPLYKKLPTRGFSHVAFAQEVAIINLNRLQELFEEGETVSVETLQAKGYLKGSHHRLLKILGQGELKKKLHFKVDSFSESARQKLGI